MKLVEHFQYGLNSPICLTWELTYACNLACVHCLSSSGRRDPRELSTDECKAVVDELQRMQVFYVNIGGGEPTVRPDFWELLDYAISHDVGVKFSTNGIKLDKKRAAQLAATDYVDIQISLDGATAEVNDHVRGPGSYATAIRALENLAEAGFGQPKISVVMTRQNVDQLDEFKAIADKFGAQLRITRLRPSGRGADVWDELHPLPEQQRALYDWLVARGEGVLTGDSFFHLSAYGQALPGLNLCGAGRVVCLIDPVGDVYACPFAIHENFLAGNVRSPGGFEGCGGTRSCSPTCAARRPAGRARRARSTTRVRAAAWRRSSSPGCHWTGRTRSACVGSASRRWRPGRPRRRSRAPRSTIPGRLPEKVVAVTAALRRGRCRWRSRSAPPAGKPDRACDENPLAGFALPVVGG